MHGSSTASLCERCGSIAKLSDLVEDFEIEVSGTLIERSMELTGLELWLSEEHSLRYI